MPLRRRSCAVAVGALVLTSCGGPRDEGPVPPASDRAPSVTVTFQDGALHTFTPEERDAITAVAE
ncbi:MAG TPA: hypothetical protein VEA78_12965, partial [Acidimicrobiales bacterium]|nr:hypothetical protein [Acidimicrobiales bacterium]